MFPESGYLVNNTRMEYFKFNHFTGEQYLHELLSNDIWSKSNTYFYISSAFDLQPYASYRDIRHLKRPHSA